MPVIIISERQTNNGRRCEQTHLRPSYHELPSSNVQLSTLLCCRLSFAGVDSGNAVVVDIIVRVGRDGHRRIARLLSFAYIQRYCVPASVARASPNDTRALRGLYRPGFNVLS